MYKRRKKTAASRKPGAYKAPARRKRRRIAGTSTSSSPSVGAATLMLGGKRYKKASCHKTKTDAKNAAKSKRNAGALARVVKSGVGYCVFSRGRASKG